MVRRSIDIVNEGSLAPAANAVDLIRHAAEEKDCAQKISNEVEIMCEAYLQNYDKCIFDKLKTVDNIIHMLYEEHAFNNKVDSELTKCWEGPLIPRLQEHITDISSATDSIMSLLGQAGYAIVHLLHAIEVCSTFFTGYNIIHAVHEAHCCENPSPTEPPITA